MSDLDLDRQWMLDTLLDECSISGDSAGPATWNEEEGISEYPADDVVYQGPCSVSQTVSDRRIAEGQNPQVLGEWTVRIPIEVVAVESGQVVEIVAVRAGGDPGLVGRKFTVRRVGARSSAVFRRLGCDVRERTSP